MGFFSSDSTTSTNNNQTNQFDQRVVLGNGAAQVSGWGRNTENSNNVYDRSDRRTSDSRDMSVHNYTGTDGGAVDIAKFNANLLQAVSENQGETVRALAQMGTKGITDQAQAATNLFATGSAEAGRAWGHTVDKSSELIDRLLTSASATVTGAQTVARDAISSFQPTENKQAGTMNYALLAAVAIAAIFILKKA